VLATVEDATRGLLGDFTPEEGANYFKVAGYAPSLTGFCASGVPGPR
jgi:hypothetical protein